MADARARREDETLQEWLARLARERHARSQLSRGGAHISDVTPPVAPLVDIEPTVAEQVEQTVAEQPATQARMPNLFDQNLPESGGDGHVNLMNQMMFSSPGDMSEGERELQGSLSFGDRYNILRRGMLQKGMAGAGESDWTAAQDPSEIYRQRPWLKDVFAEAAGAVPDLFEAGVGAVSPVTRFFKEGWEEGSTTPDTGKFKHPIVGGADWWAEHLGLVDTEGTYESWFSDKTKKQKGKFPYWPWKDSEDLPEVEIKLDISNANPAFRPQTTADKTDGKSQVSQRTGSTPSVMENSKAKLLMQMFGKTDMDSKGIEDIMARAEPDYNMALLIGNLNGKGVGPANAFMNSVLQGAALQYRMNKDQQDKAFQIMTTKPTTYYFHDAKMGVDPINLYPWDNVPKGYTTQRPQLTGQQRNRQQYQEILDEYTGNREAGLDAAIDALISNEGPMFSAWDQKYFEDPQAARYAKERSAAIIVSGWFNPGGGVHYTRQERKEFSEAWKAGKFEEVKRMIRDKNNSWPEEFDALVRSKWGS